ncbi:hypothetical protein EJ05DRAFT_507280 [Pseudovirgaria hyperparasitica]|uniref:Uncharacterized protein n=1 Tax=Pseudovirgaria hyperparasitica TaxID=470096 RepID=A0A6A6WFV5_9PEZI|nr:uncharacterized protein EJ05DRAFT_507280 [Pseudovirgaria hyperparasitica]KAF2761633.1 hypothetical protein EJ05DRAFT_507280 [Pseudovirgaria hyperparasitica]
MPPCAQWFAHNNMRGLFETTVYKSTVIARNNAQVENLPRVAPPQPVTADPSGGIHFSTELYIGLGVGLAVAVVAIVVAFIVILSKQKKESRDLTMIGDEALGIYGEKDISIVSVKAVSDHDDSRYLASTAVRRPAYLEPKDDRRYSLFLDITVGIRQPPVSPDKGRATKAKDAASSFANQYSPLRLIQLCDLKRHCHSHGSPSLKRSGASISIVTRGLCRLMFGNFFRIVNACIGYQYLKIEQWKHPWGQSHDETFHIVLLHPKWCC